jgi:hypothetical protein
MNAPDGKIVPESDEVAGHQYRTAQANRLIRYCNAQGADPGGVLAGTIRLDLSPICGADGKIVPEDVDYPRPS